LWIEVLAGSYRTRNPEIEHCLIKGSGSRLAFGKW